MNKQRHLIRGGPRHHEILAPIAWCGTKSSAACKYIEFSISAPLPEQFRIPSDLDIAVYAYAPDSEMASKLASKSWPVIVSR